MESGLKELLVGLYHLGFTYLCTDYEFEEVEFFKHCTFIKNKTIINHEGSLKSKDNIATDIISYLKEDGYHSGEYVAIKNLIPHYDTSIIKFDEYTINQNRRMIFKNNEPIAFTTKEYDVLEYFLLNRGLAISREQIVTEVWDTNYYGSDRVVDDTLRRIRKKIPTINIHTIYGYGYRFD